MNSQPNAMTDSFRATQVAAPAVISPLRRFYSSLRPELWESPSIYVAPLVVAGLSLLGFGLGLPFHFHATPQAQKYESMAQAYLFVGFLLMGTNFVVAVFYCLDALHGERRDRSILFWKSLPVSDVTAVLAKASIPIVILPLIAFAATVATQFVMLLMNSALLAGRGMAVAPLWAHVSLVQMSLALLDRKSTRLNSSHTVISYAVFCLKKKKKEITNIRQTSSTKTPYRLIRCTNRTAP